jgi:hypothetical protein
MFRCWLAGLVLWGGLGCKNSQPATQSEALPVQAAEADGKQWFQGVRYYAGFEGPTGLLYGTNELSKEKAEARAHVEITFENDFPVLLRSFRAKGREEFSLSIMRDAQSVYTRKRNRFGVLEEERFCTLENKGGKGSLLCSGRTGANQRVFLGCDFWREEFDADRHLLSVSCLDAEKKPTRSAHNWGSLAFSVDEFGREFERRALSTSGEAVDTEQGFSLRRTLYHDNGRPGRVLFFDAAGKPGVGPDGVAELRYSYDSDSCRTATDPASCVAGRGEGVSMVSYFGGDGSAVLAQNGAHQVSYNRNEFGDEVEWFYLGTTGEVLPSTSQQCMHFTAEYDERGLLTRKRCVDASGALVLADGVAITEFQYDERGLVVKTLFKGLGGVPSAPGLCFGEGSEYDERGRVIRDICLDGAGNPFQPSGFYCSLRYTYNDDGFLSKKEDLDCQDMPSSVRAGIFATEYQYDAAGHITLMTYQDQSGGAMRSVFGYSQERTTYDALGRSTTRSFWHDGMPIDAVRLCFDAKMCVGKEGVPNAYHQMTFSYSPSGELLLLEFSDQAGTPLGVRDCKQFYCP